MKSWALVLTVLFFLAGSDATETKTPSVKEIMQKLHGGKGLRIKLNKDMRAEKLDWTEIQKDTKEILKFAEALPKNEPPRGEKESWQKLSEVYIANAKALDTAADKQDTASLKSAFAKMGGSCTKCHNAHKPPMD